ncbi:c-type cytochrome [Budvicia diplopodorum]|uniref:c-type cytochrome n=1 Tax=Budvicia diplopodorum TaxID=1119056 RepID=UPI001358B0E2|nr:c-type cytochrome [Budvicia diplopodorum]
MNKQRAGLLLALLVCSTPVLAQTTPVQTTMAPNLLYKNNCASCHGRFGEKTALGKSRPLTDLTQQEIADGLTARKAGKIEGAGNKVKARLTDEDITALAEFVVTLKR